MRTFTKSEDEILSLLDNNNINDVLCETCLDAFSTDEAMRKAIDWLKENPNFTGKDVSKILVKFGVDSEDFSTTTEVED